MSTRAAAVILLAGPPRKLSGIVAADVAERVIPITLKLGRGILGGRAHVRPFGEGAVELRLRLPAETPPGTYNGEASFGERAVPVTVEVEPLLKLRVQPQRSTLAAAPGEATEFAVDIINAGNVTYQISKSDTLDLDDAAGQDRSLGRALRATLAPGERRVDRFFEEMRDRHGGEARVNVLSGAGPLAAAEARQLRCQLEVPGAVVPGRSYTGAWQLGNAAHVLVLDVNRGAVLTKGRSAT